MCSVIEVSRIKMNKRMKHCCFLSEITKIRDRAIFMLVLNYDLKAEEIADLAMGDIDYKNRRIIIKQNRNIRSRIFSMSRYHSDTLAAYMRVRSPTIERKLFLVEEGYRRGQPQSAQEIHERIRFCA